MVYQVVPELSVEPNKLEKMFEQQQEFMELLRLKRNFPEFPVDVTTKVGQKFIKDIGHDCMHEMFEALHTLRDSKQHRETVVGGFDKGEFLEEMIDSLHYAFEIFILMGFSIEQVYDAFMSKGRTNVERIESGY